MTPDRVTRPLHRAGRAGRQPFCTAVGARAATWPADRVSMRLPIISTTAAAGVLATAALAALTVPPVAAEATTTASPVMSSTFLQPSGTTIPWTAKQYQSEITLERAAGITGIIDQWTVDEDANRAYYPDTTGWYPRASDMTGPLLSAAGSAGDTVWLGLAN